MSYQKSHQQDQMQRLTVTLDIYSMSNNSELFPACKIDGPTILKERT